MKYTEHQIKNIYESTKKKIYFIYFSWCFIYYNFFSAKKKNGGKDKQTKKGGIEIYEKTKKKQSYALHFVQLGYFGKKEVSQEWGVSQSVHLRAYCTIFVQMIHILNALKYDVACDIMHSPYITDHLN